MGVIKRYDTHAKSSFGFAYPTPAYKNVFYRLGMGVIKTNDTQTKSSFGFVYPTPAFYNVLFNDGLGVIKTDGTHAKILNHVPTLHHQKMKK